MKARIETPSGYRPVYSGKVRAGDRRFFPDTRGRSSWGLVHEGDCAVGADVEGFYAIIRPLPPVQKPDPLKFRLWTLPETRKLYERALARSREIQEGKDL